MRRIQYAGHEYHQRKLYARHTHHSEGISYYGNGITVMAVSILPKTERPWAEVIGEDGKNIWGEDFTYTDYFPGRESV